MQQRTTQSAREGIDLDASVGDTKTTNLGIYNAAPDLARIETDAEFAEHCPMHFCMSLLSLSWLFGYGKGGHISTKRTNAFTLSKREKQKEQFCMF